MSRKNVILASILLLLAAGWSAAQDSEPEETPFTPQNRTNQRSLGDQSFGITAGVFVPLPTYLLQSYGTYSPGFTDSKLSVGGMGSLTYSFYLNDNLKLGVNLTGSFTRDINSIFAYLIPVSIKASWEFHPWSRVSIPVHLSMGMCMTSWNDYFVIDMILKPGLGVYWDYSYEWSFGMDFGYWFIPQLGTGSGNENQRSIASFLDISLTAEYHF